MIDLNEIYAVYPEDENQEVLSKIEKMFIDNQWTTEEVFLLLDDSKAILGKIQFYQNQEVYFQSRDGELKTYPLRDIKILYWYHKEMIEKKKLEIQAEILKKEEEKKQLEEKKKKEEEVQKKDVMGFQIEVNNPEKKEKKEEEVKKNTDSINKKNEYSQANYVWWQFSVGIIGEGVGPGWSGFLDLDQLLIGADILFGKDDEKNASLIQFSGLYSLEEKYKGFFIKFNIGGYKSSDSHFVVGAGAGYSIEIRKNDSYFVVGAVFNFSPTKGVIPHIYGGILF